MARPIKIKESDLTNMVKRILAEKGVNEALTCHPPGLDSPCNSCNGVSGQWERNCEGVCGGHPECFEVGGGKHKGHVVTKGDGEEYTVKGKDYEKIDHSDRDRFDGRKSRVVGVDSDIDDQRWEKNVREGYERFGCKFLQSRKSLNEDKLTNLFETKRDIREQNNLLKKLRFIESAIRHSKCGTIIKEHTETTPNTRNNYRRTRKLIYENMDWDAVRRNNNRRLRK
jgi:hypothetical protein